MSKITLAPNASGAAIFTIAAPATATDRTLTLPDATGTVLSSADLSSQAQAEAGTNNTTLMTPLRAAQAITAQTPVNVGVGAGQTWQTVSRALSTSYQNLTVKPIMVAISFSTSSTSGNRLMQVSADNSTWFTVSQYGPNVSNAGFSWIVPTSYYYRYQTLSGDTLTLWTELR